MIDPQLDGKLALVTGANNPHGIGAGIAKAFAALGAKVIENPRGGAEAWLVGSRSKRSVGDTGAV